MPRPVYSTRFVVGTAPGPGQPTPYTVPVGFVAVVKDVVAVLAGGTAPRGGWGIPGTAFLGGFSLSAAAPAYHWYGSQVFNAGDSFGALWQADSFYYAISGYLLTVT